VTWQVPMIGPITATTRAQTLTSCIASPTRP